MEDEKVRQALDRGCDRNHIIDVFDVSRRTTFNKQKRACAYDFPLSAFNRGGRPTDSDWSERSPTTTDTGKEDGDEQQRLDAVPDQDPDSLGRTETWGTTETTPEAGTSNESVEDTDQAVSENGAEEELRVHLQHAIEALQEVNSEL
jgi:hypothetical protein